MSEFEKDLGKKKEGTDTLNQNQENSTKPAVPAEGENNAPAAPAKKRIAAVYRPQNSTQKRPAGNRQQGGQRPARPNGSSGMQVRPTTNAAPAAPAKAAETAAAPAQEKKAETVKAEAPVQEIRENLDDMKEKYEHKKEEIKLKHKDDLDELKAKYDNLVKETHIFQKRIIKAFPNLTSRRYEEQLVKLKEKTWKLKKKNKK
mgnify:CR=1 FL=1